MTIKLERCIIFSNIIEYFGHVIATGKLKVDLKSKKIIEMQHNGEWNVV